MIAVVHHRAGGVPPRVQILLVLGPAREQWDVPVVAGPGVLPVRHPRAQGGRERDAGGREEARRRRVHPQAVLAVGGGDDGDVLGFARRAARVVGHLRREVAVEAVAVGQHDVLVGPAGFQPQPGRIRFGVWVWPGPADTRARRWRYLETEEACGDEESQDVACWGLASRWEWAAHDYGGGGGGGGGKEPNRERLLTTASSMPRLC